MMARKKASKVTAKPAGKKAGKKVLTRSRKPPAGGRRSIGTSGSASPNGTPQEWRGGRIVLEKPPAKPLKGRKAKRVPATNIGDANDRLIPRKVSNWFVRKLDPSHKVWVRNDDSYDAPKVAHVSPEAAHLLRKSAAAWARLADAERNDARKREQESLDSLATITAPKEFQKNKVVLAKPQKAVTKAYCWKPDFEGEVYQAVLHYYGYLPSEHVGSITDPRGYPAKAMSPEAAALYRAHRSFWEAKHLESKADSKAASAARRQAAEISIERAATSAGLSRVELEAKLDRLGMLVEEDNLQLAAAMIAGFGDAWLYESLLSGAAIEPNGSFKPGKALKRFGTRAELILVQAIAAMPDGLSLHGSVRKDAAMKIAIAADTADIVAEIALLLPNLRAQWDYGDLDDLDELLPRTAAFLAKHSEDLCLSVRKLDLKTAACLAKHKGTLELRFTELPETVAAVLAQHRGDLGFTTLRSISASAAAALEKHIGRLELGESDRTFTLDANAARHLGRHAGSVNLPGLKRLDSDAAMALANQRHGIGINEIEAFVGPGGVRLCERLAGSSEGYLALTALKTLSAECASALAGFKGQLTVSVKSWSDDALIALAAHRGELEIDPPRLSAEVAAALSRRSDSTALTFSEFKAISLGDEAASILSSYEGELAFAGDVEMSSAAAESLTQRKSLILFRSKIKPAIRKIFESAGTWKDSAWTRRARPAKKASSNHAGDIRHSKIPKRS